MTNWKALGLSLGLVLGVLGGGSLLAFGVGWLVDTYPRLAVVLLIAFLVTIGYSMFKDDV